MSQDKQGNSFGVILILSPEILSHSLSDHLPPAGGKTTSFPTTLFTLDRILSCIPLSGTTVTAPAPISPLLCQEFLLQKLLHLLFNLSQAAVQSPDGALLLAGAGWRWELALVFFQHLQHLLLFQGELLEEGQRLYQPSLTLLLLFLPGSSLLSPSIITSTCFIQLKNRNTKIWFSFRTCLTRSKPPP